MKKLLVFFLWISQALPTLFAQTENDPLVFEDATIARILLKASWSGSGQLARIDANNDGQISLAEAEAVTGEVFLQPGIGSNRVETYQDLKYFTNLQTLIISDLQSPEFDLPTLPALEFLRFRQGRVDQTIQVGDQPNLLRFQTSDSSAKQLEIFGCPKLLSVFSWNSDIPVFQFSELPALTEVEFGSHSTDLEFVNVPDTVESIRVRGSALNDQIFIIDALPANLKTLNLSYLDTELPDFPSTLNELFLVNVVLPYLPAVVDLEQLSVLSVVENHLMVLPELPPNLVRLELRDNQLTVLPDLPESLTQLSLQRNQLTALPDLPSSLTDLSAGENLLTALPDLPTGLQILSVSQNELETLPIDSSHTALIRLEAAGNLLTQVPDLVAELTVLDLSGNQLSQLPALDLTNLEVFKVSDNQLQHLPNLTWAGLQEARIGSNPLVSFPVVYERIPLLDLSGGFPFVVDLRPIRYVQELIYRDAGLTEVPPLPLTIPRLDLSGNRIRNMSAFRGFTTTYLNLSNNQLNDVDVLPFFRFSLDLSGNNLTNGTRLASHLIGMPRSNLTANPLPVDLRGNNLDARWCDLQSRLNPNRFRFMTEDQQSGINLDCMDSSEEPLAIGHQPLATLLAEAEILDAEGEPVHIEDFSAIEQDLAFTVQSIHIAPPAEDDTPISDLSDLVVFPLLKNLEITGHRLENMDAITQLGGLIRLNLANNQLTALPPLPAYLCDLDVSFNRLTDLPELPQGLAKLIARNNRLQSLPDLPAKLVELNVQSNRLSTLPPLPDRMRSLFFSANKVENIDRLPADLRHLYGHSNGLKSLPDLPPSVVIIYLQYNDLTSFPALPNRLRTLAIDGNPLTGLPASLPRTLERLTLSGVHVPVLSKLPLNLRVLNASGCGIEELDVLPDGLVPNIIRMDLSDNLLQDVNNLDDLVGINANTQFADLRGNLLGPDSCNQILKWKERYDLELLYQTQRDGILLECIRSEFVSFADPDFEAFMMTYPLPGEDLLMDADGDGRISRDEAKALQTLTLDGKETGALYSVSGMEAFVNLREVTLLNQPDLQSLPDLYDLHALRRLAIRDSGLTRLDLLPSNLRVIDAPDIGLEFIKNFPRAIEGVYLSRNRLQSLPNFHPESRNLRVFEVADNLLETIPEWRYLWALNHIDVSNNRLETLPDLVLQSSLHIFHADNNELTRLPWFSSQVDQRNWSFKNNQLTDIGVLNHLEFVLDEASDTLDFSGNTLADVLCEDLKVFGARPGTLILDEVVADRCPNL